MENINVRVSGPQAIQDNLKSYNIVVLKPNMVGDENILTQEMLSTENTKYVIRWNYDLGGNTITVPAGCLIEIEGGSFTNGTLVGNNTVLINESGSTSLLDITRTGTWQMENVFEKGEGANSAQQAGTEAKAIGNNSLAEGSNTEATGIAAHAEGIGSIASGAGSHAEGRGYAQAPAAHAEGIDTVAEGQASHAGGKFSSAKGIASLASGLSVVANNEGEAAFGKFNESDITEGKRTIFSVGNGTTAEDKKNAFEIKENDDIHIWANGTNYKLQDLYHNKVYLKENLQYIEYPFNDFVDNVEIEQVGYSGEITNIVYDVTNKAFLAVVQTLIDIKYYNAWIGEDAECYMHPLPILNYLCAADGKRYVWNGTTLIESEEGIKVNILTQEMMSEPNVTYIVEYDYYLNRQSITVPAGCVIKFDRGSFQYGTLVGNRTIVEYLTNLDSVLNVTREGTFTYKTEYVPNNEDITINSKEELEFANKSYLPENFSGLGRVYLRKNMVRNGNLLTQEMINQPNTIYIIQYDYELSERIELYAEFAVEIDNVTYYYDNTPITTLDFQSIGALDGAVFISDPEGTPAVIGSSIKSDVGEVYLARTGSTGDIYYYEEQSITIPQNCVLQFEGGSLKNGEVVGQNTVINAGLVKIFDTDLVLDGSWNTPFLYKEWFGSVEVKHFGDKSERPSGLNIYVGFQYLQVDLEHGTFPIWASEIVGDSVTWIKADGTDPDA